MFSGTTSIQTRYQVSASPICSILIPEVLLLNGRVPELPPISSISSSILDTPQYSKVILDRKDFLNTVTAQTLGQVDLGVIYSNNFRLSYLRGLAANPNLPCNIDDNDNEIITAYTGNAVVPTADPEDINNCSIKTNLVLPINIPCLTTK